MDGKEILRPLRVHIILSFIFGILGNGMLLFGLSGRMLNGSIWFSGVVLLSCVGWAVLSISKHWKCVVHYFHSKSIWHVFFFAFSIGIILLTFLYGVLPPYSRDGLIHHLALPWLYLQTGAVFPLDFAEQQYNPMLIDFWFLIPLILDSDWLSAWIHFAFAIGIAHLIFLYFFRQSEDLTGLVLAGLFLVLPQTIQSSTQAYVDLGVGYFALLSFMIVIELPKMKEKVLVWFFSLGWIIGCGMACKYNGFLVASIWLCGAFIFWAHQEIKFHWRMWAVLSLGTSLALFPWLMRNGLWTGNPIYPYLRNSLGWIPASPYAIQDIPALLHRVYIYQESWLDILLLPVRIFIQGKEGDPQLFDGQLTWVLLPLITSSFFLRKSEWKERRLLWFLVGIYFLVVLGLRILRMRYLMPVIPLFFILSGIGMHALFSKFSRQVRVAFLVAMGLVCIFYTWESWGRFQKNQGLQYIRGKLSRDAFLEKRLPEYATQTFANQHLDPSQHKILFVFLGHRGYYSEIPYIYDFHDPGRSWRRWLDKAEGPQDLSQQIHAEGITHLMTPRDFFWANIEDGMMIPNSQQKKILRDFLKEHVLWVQQRNQIWLAKIK